MSAARVMVRRSAAVAAAAVVLSMVFALGCGSSLPPTHYYVIELDPSAATNSSGLDIGVRPFAVDSPYNQDRIVYRVGEGSAEVGFYSYHLWAAPLQSMLPAAIATGLEGVSGAGVIEPVATGRSYDAFLHGRVIAVEEVDLTDRQVVRAVIELRLMTRDGKELWAEVVSARGETRTEEVGVVVEALATALAEALAGTRESLARTLATVPAPPPPTPR
jgi:uncharacterized lipoprotein YmbA